MNAALREKITVLVNVHNRPRHLARQLDYIHAHYDRILILDSSDVEYAGKDDYPNAEYHYYPGWEYVDKLADIIKKVETPYVHLCADDDFFIPASVFKCLNFLESNPDYASVHGHYLSFHWDGHHFDIRPLYTSYMGRDICNKEVSSRLHEAFNPYIQLLYGVHRSENLRDCFCRASENKVMNHRLVELLVTAVAVLNGKHKVLPIVYGARETLYNSAGTFIPTINAMLKQDSAKSEYARFLDIIALHLAKKCGIESELALTLVKESLNQYLSNRRRKLIALPQLLPPSLRIIINRFRYSSGGLISTRMASRIELEGIETYVRKHNC